MENLIIVKSCLIISEIAHKMQSHIIRLGDINDDELKELIKENHKIADIAKKNMSDTELHELDAFRKNRKK